MSEVPTANDEGTVTFNVKTAGGQKWSLTLPLTTTTADIKSKLSGEDYANVPSTSQRLIYSGKVLKDHETLATHNVKDGNTMHLVKSAPSNQRQNPAASTSTTIPNAGTPQPPSGVPQNLAAGTGNDPLAGLTGARYAGFAGLPSLDSLAPSTPDDMLRRLQDPNFAQQMNEALQNPQMIDMMINMNPQLRAMGPQARQMLQSEQFRRMMTNPEALRSMMQLQNSMGGMGAFGGGMGGAGGQEAFPAPGVTNASEQQPQGQTPSQNTQQQNMPDPFGMFGGMPGFGGAGGQGGNAAANPFMALLNPSLAQQGQEGQTNTNTTNSAQPPNPFAAFGNNPYLAQLMNNPEAANNAMAALFGGGSGGAGGLGGMGGFGASPPDTRPPEERYSTQLRQLNEMGFHNFDRNIQALSRSGGDVNGALEWLFSQPQ